ncbi:MutS-related protein [Acidithiobacillus sp. M4-SHS-6]|uniref:MutS-related protein n=1 Tax=Acidithiobacillus sp. M4-SHS-6 TaxID=3383024 RepID=UPI0039BE9F7E
MKSLSLLFHDERPDLSGDSSEPAYFHDLGLDQVINKLLEGREEYKLNEYFYCLPQDMETIQFRQAVMGDMGNETLYNNLSLFSNELSGIRKSLARTEKLYYPLQQQRCYLEIALRYQQTLKKLVVQLSGVTLGSRGLEAFTHQLLELMDSASYKEFENRTSTLMQKMESIRYDIIVKGNRVTVQPCLDENDYTLEVAHNWYLDEVLPTIDNDSSGVNAGYDLNHVEGQILEGVAQLYPEPFHELDTYCKQYMMPRELPNTTFTAESLKAVRYPFMAGDILIWERELQFYLAYLGCIAPLKHQGLQFTIPEMLVQSKNIRAEQTFDLVLAIRLLEETGQQVVVNDLQLSEEEQMFVVTGPNQGGKTTFARTVGQLHHLAGLGCPVPGLNTRLCLCDGIYTHFSYREDIRTGHGKLEEDLLRLHKNLERATASSIFILNELFDSTSYDDALYLSEQIIQQLLEKESLTVWVTFIDAMASLGPQIVSLMSMVESEDLSKRTFKIRRKPADGLAYALSLAEKYGLTYEALMEKIA